MSATERLRCLPSVSELLDQAGELVTLAGHDLATQTLREALAQARTDILNGAQPPTTDDLLHASRARLREMLDYPRPLINATGVVIHTNLGRAPLSRAAQQAMQVVAAGYSALEFDLRSGQRGRRGQQAERLICMLTGAEDALIVNNCAAATVLMLAAIAAGLGVVISRGQLVEIGGGFRIPEIMAQSGAQLIEVGTTNRTRVADYEQALRAHAAHPPGVAAILRVHPSNFRLRGFTQEVGIAELVQLAHAHTKTTGVPLPVLDDIGSGALVDTSQFGLRREPMPQESIRAGAGLVAFSGDKLLGGPQAGLLIGQRAWIARCRSHPLARAFRADKFTLAGLTATLWHYARGEAEREVPVVRMLAMSKDEIGRRVQQVMNRLAAWAEAREVCLALRSGHSAVGGGTLPDESLPTTLLAISSVTRSPHQLLATLRAQGVIARIEDDHVVLDLRTVLDDDALVSAIQNSDG
jgi:L-seryl-tRNA(Ser) seleniumtransferase